MADSQEKSSTEKIERQGQGKPSQSIEKQPQDIEKQPQSFKKQPQQSVRRSARLEERRQQTIDKAKNVESKYLFPSPPTGDIAGKEASRNSLVPPLPDAVKPQCSPNESGTDGKLDRNRKRQQEARSPTLQGETTKKRTRASPEGRTTTVEDKEAASGTRYKKVDPINHWIREGHWPREYFEQDFNNMNVPLARKKSLASLRRQVLEANAITPTLDTEDKSAPYRDPSYAVLLADRGSFLHEFCQGIIEDSRKMCQTLLNAEQAVPQDSDTLFRDDVFRATCEKLRDRNEARVISDIARLIVPSAETLATYGALHLEHLIVGMDERWNESIPLTPTSKLPQPDFSVGFKRSAFTQDQLKKMEPFTGNVWAAIKLSSFFLATWRMYFPFFTCEVKSGAWGLDVADRQNANSMTLAVKGVVELFKFVKREKDLHQKLLAFSISHDDKMVRIFGHYPVIDGDITTFYRHHIKTFDFTSEEGKEKWTAYKFTKNLYSNFMPTHHKLICSAIDDIPANLNFGISLGDSSTPKNASAEKDSNLPDSQDTQPLKKPRLSAVARLKEEVDRLNDRLKEMSTASSRNDSMLQQELERLRQESDRRIEEQKQENERQKQESDRRIEQQKQESDRRIEEQKQENERQKQESDQRIEQQKQESDRRIEEQKQENERQKQENERQKQESDRRIEQQKQESDRRFEQQKQESDRRFEQQQQESEKRHAELMDMLKEQREENKRLMDMISQRLS